MRQGERPLYWAATGLVLALDLGARVLVALRLSPGAWIRIGGPDLYLTFQVGGGFALPLHGPTLFSVASATLVGFWAWRLRRRYRSTVAQVGLRLILASCVSFLASLALVGMVVDYLWLRPLSRMPFALGDLTFWVGVGLVAGAAVSPRARVRPRRALGGPSTKLDRFAVSGYARSIQLGQFVVAVVLLAVAMGRTARFGAALEELRALRIALEPSREACLAYWRDNGEWRAATDSIRRGVMQFVSSDSSSRISFADERIITAPVVCSWPSHDGTVGGMVAAFHDSTVWSWAYSAPPSAVAAGLSRMAEYWTGPTPPPIDRLTLRSRGDSIVRDVAVAIRGDFPDSLETGFAFYNSQEGAGYFSGGVRLAKARSAGGWNIRGLVGQYQPSLLTRMGAATPTWDAPVLQHLHDVAPLVWDKKLEDAWEVLEDRASAEASSIQAFGLTIPIALLRNLGVPLLLGLSSVLLVTVLTLRRETVDITACPWFPTFPDALAGVLSYVGIGALPLISSLAILPGYGGLSPGGWALGGLSVVIHIGLTVQLWLLRGDLEASGREAIVLP